jgi:hypothetical protein
VRRSIRLLWHNHGPMPLRRSSRIFLASSTVALVAAAFAGAACIGDDPVPAAPAGDSGAGEDGGTVGDGGTGEDGASCAEAKCADPSTLRRCDGTTEVCTFGCDTTDGAHCRSVYPSGLVRPDDLQTAGVQAITISANAKFVTDTGEITDHRPANDDPLLMEVNDGIGFRLADDGAGHKLAIWTFDSLTIPDGVTVRFTSTNPVALVAAKTIAIVGVVDARGYADDGVLCGSNALPGPGGFPGGTAQTGPYGGGGPGGGLPPDPVSTYSGGAGGGGHGGIGGKGGPGNDAPAMRGGDGGVTYQAPSLVPLVGGAGGGATIQGSGGSGGGAVHLVAPESITIGGGPALGGINAGGCQGIGGGFGNSAGGGGAGGSILVETRTLTMAPNGKLAACGGGGGSGSNVGTAGQLSGPGTGASAASGYGFGGGGGCFSANGGGGASASTYSGGSAGGGAGRIRINNRTGSFQPPAGSLLPPLGISPSPPSSIGTLDVR